MLGYRSLEKNASRILLITTCDVHLTTAVILYIQPVIMNRCQLTPTVAEMCMLVKYWRYNHWSLKAGKKYCNYLCIENRQHTFSLFFLICFVRGGKTNRRELYAGPIWYQSVCVVAAVADAIRTSLGPRGMDKMVSYKLLSMHKVLLECKYWLLVVWV